MTDRPVSNRNDIVVQELADEILIYDLLADKAFCLNETAKQVYELCNGQRTIPEISRLMGERLKTEVGEDLIRLAVNDLRKNKLVEKEKKASLPLTGQTRREIVKRVGFASLVALPVISMIAAPRAAMAQSGGSPLLALCAGPTCSAGLSCISCTTGSCAATMVCCVSGPFAAQGPGGNISTCDDQATCNGLTSNCCSAMVSWAASPSCPASQGPCTCA